MLRESSLPLALLAALLVGAPATAGTRIDLDGPWQFRIDPDGRGEAEGWARAVPADAETVTVPHTWGLGRHAEHEGLAWYWREVVVPPALRGRRLELHFGATFYRARLFVNGQLAGQHEGGHTAWHADVTSLVGDRATLAVEIDNRRGRGLVAGHRIAGGAPRGARPPPHRGRGQGARGAVVGAPPGRPLPGGGPAGGARRAVRRPGFDRAGEGL